MKRMLLFAFATLMLISCKEEKEVIKEEKTLAYHEIESEPYKHLYGYWTGTLYSDYDAFPDDTTMAPYEPVKMSLKINRIVKNAVFGITVIGGEIRPIKGELTSNDGTVVFHLREPGSERGSGKYEMTFKNDTIKGNWQRYVQEEGHNPIKKMELLQRKFVYNPHLMLDSDSELVDWDARKTKDTIYKNEDGSEEKDVFETYRAASEEVFKFNASTQKLTEEQLKNLRKLDLEILRNTIFARHGYSFKRSSLRYFFEVCPWYVPVSNNVDAELTKIEKDNIALLKRMEQYAEDTYEYFGR